MGLNLPDELIQAVLCDCLHISEQDFADTGRTSPFQLVARSASHILLVSKRWMRIATPEFYRTVILRSVAQSTSLLFALTSNPALGSHVRQMRIEGAYGDALGHIAAQCPRVVDICISLRVWSVDKARGIVTALDQLDPTRVVLILAPEKLPSNIQHELILQALCRRITTWRSLRVFKFASSHIRQPSGHARPDFIVYPSLMNALQDAIALEEVALCLGPGLYSNDDSGLMTEVATAIQSLLTANASVKITFYRVDLLLEDGKRHNLGLDLSENEDIILRSKISAPLQSRLTRVCPRAPKLLTPAREITTESERPFNRPFASFTPSVRAAIFSRIVQFAIEIPRGGYVAPEVRDRAWVDLDGIDLQPAFALQLTSREFKILALSTLARRVILRRRSHASMLVRLLDQHPSLAGSIRAVTFKANLSARDQKDILSRITSLKSAFGVSVSGVLQVLVEDGRSSGLRHLGVTSLKGTKLQFKLSLQHFAALNSLSLDVGSRFYALDDPEDPEIQLGELTKLTLDSCPSSVIDILRRASLPNLAVLDVHSLAGSSSGVDGLIASLGQSLRRTLVLDVPDSLWTCTPRLVDLDVFDNFNVEDVVTRTFSSAHHPTLQNLRFHCPLGRLSSAGESRKVVFDALMRSITREKFSRLDSVQLCLGFNLWPCDTRKSPWPEHARRLAQQGIRLLDSKGVEWRQPLV